MSKIKSEYSGMRSDLILNKNDLINSNPGAVASGSSSSGNGRSSMASDNGSDQSGMGKQGKSVRRRKANRACSHCQKAHLTCDDSRPCERCVKKGLSDTCTDGARKKAKYLLDEDELLELKREKLRKANGTQPQAESSKAVKIEAEEIRNEVATPIPTDWATPASNETHMSPNHMARFGRNTTLAPLSMAESEPNLPDDIKNKLLPESEGSDIYGPLSGFSPSSSQHVFGNETTSLEYSILSSMLNGIDPAWLSGSSDGTQGGDNSIGSVLGAEKSQSGPFSHMGIDGMPWQLNSENASLWTNPSESQDGQNHVEPLHHMEPPVIANGSTDRVAAFDALEVPSPEGAANNAMGTESESRNGPLNFPASTMGSIAKFKGSADGDDEKRAAAAIAAATGKDKKPDAIWRERVKHIYGDQMKPFRYTEGYHFLIKYVTANLEKTQVLRIVRALAIFRPSLIALQMPLTEEDEIFVERSIQRTMLEFEKLISFSGTPTVVWRRTCEIVVVGAEFSMLTQWSKEYLRGRYIYELFEKPSILEYWEKFALHAFENTAQSIHMQVTLKTSMGNSVRCSACFSIKRDVFDLPSLIVGNFLPILS